MNLRFVILSALFGAMFASIVPTVQAQDATDWSVEVIPAGVAIQHIASDSIGDVVGVVYRNQATGLVHFWRRDGADATFQQIDNDVGAEVIAQQLNLYAVSVNHWIFCAYNTGSTGFYCWHSSDNGATWTKGAILAGTSNTLYDFKFYPEGTGVNIQAFAGARLNVVRTTDYGATWSASAIYISDNQGDPNDAPSAQINNPGGATIWEGGTYNDITVDFVESSGGGGGVYNVHSDDAAFWTVPYTAEGGAVKDPRVSGDYCGGINYGEFSVDPYSVIRAGPVNRPYAHVRAAGNDYVCAFGHALPSATPTNDIKISSTSTTAPQGRHWADCNANGQCLVGFVDETANANYVYYSAGLTTPTLSYTNAADTTTYSITLAATRGYFFYTDNSVGGQLQVASASVFTAAGSQVAVNDLTGYSMDSTGRSIVVRTDLGETIEAYSINNGALTQTGTASTTNCSPRFDGVLTEELNDQIYITYVDCDGSGDSDAFRTRDFALGPPSFPLGSDGDTCTHQEADNENDGDTDIPNEIGQVGFILAMPFNFRRCDSSGLDYASAAWTFTELNGKVGIYAVAYQTGPDQQDKADVQLDTNPAPDLIHFCAWHNYNDDTDYVGAVAANGPVGVYEATAEIFLQPSLLVDPEVHLNQRFLNNGQYGSSSGLACAGNYVAILQPDTLYVVNGLLNGTISPVSGWPVDITVTHDRGVAFTGSQRFIAWIDEEQIHIAHRIGGNETVQPLQLPTGTFMGMEFDNSGEHLAVFTSDFITLFDTSAVTCELTDSCAIEGGVGGDENPDGSQPTPTPTGGGGGGGGLIGGTLGATGATLAALATVTFFLAAGFLVTRSRVKDRDDEE